MKDHLDGTFHRSNLSDPERRIRSRIAQLASSHWFLRGTLTNRSRSCGKSNCHCAQGELHESLYLVQSHEGKLRQVCVPKAWQPRVRQAVADYQLMQTFIEEASELEWLRLMERKRKPFSAD